MTQQPLSEQLAALLPQLTVFSSPLSLRHRAIALANYITDVEPLTASISIMAPINGGLIGTFFDCDPSINPLAPDAKLPPILSRDGEEVLFDRFRLAYHHFLVRQYGIGVLGRLALSNFEDVRQFFERVIVCDGGLDLHDDLEVLTIKHKNLYVRLCLTHDSKLLLPKNGENILHLVLPETGSLERDFSLFLSALSSHKTATQ